MNNSRKHGASYIAVLACLAFALAGAAAFVFWQSHRMWNPTPLHVQDIDRIQGIDPIWLGGLDRLAIDHVYAYNSQTLRGNQYFRCHVIHEAEFAAYHNAMRRAGKSTQRADKDSAAEYLGKKSREYRAIKSWWDWPDRTDCELICFDDYSLVAFDEPNRVVYVARGDN